MLLCLLLDFAYSRIWIYGCPTRYIFKMPKFVEMFMKTALIVVIYFCLIKISMRLMKELLCFVNFYILCFCVSTPVWENSEWTKTNWTQYWINSVWLNVHNFQYSQWLSATLLSHGTDRCSSWTVDIEIRSFHKLRV